MTVYILYRDIDPHAVDKLAHEMQELTEALADDDEIGAVLEAADVAYYACKAVQYAASLVNLTVADVMSAACAKYALRARPGNPKDDAAERAAVEELWKGGNMADWWDEESPGDEISIPEETCPDPLGDDLGDCGNEAD